MSDSSDEDEDYLSDKSDASSSSGSSGEESPPRPAVPQNFFAPPFYGRPPTPLPPSPSLTSLLRPSRPTTPDASDDEHHHYLATRGGGGGGGGGGRGRGRGGGGGPNQQHNHSSVPRGGAAAEATATPASSSSSSSSPQVPTYEYYGFVLYLLSSFTFLAYLLWSYLPAPFLAAMGLTYYPDRWWALATPAFLVMTLCYIYVALASYNLEVLTLPLHSVETIVDGAGCVAVVDAKGRFRGSQRRKRKGGGGGGGLVDGSGRLRWREVWSEGTDAVLDIPLAGVCEVLYGEGREGTEGEEEEGGGGGVGDGDVMGREE